MCYPRCTCRACLGVLWSPHLSTRELCAVLRCAELSAPAALCSAVLWAAERASQPRHLLSCAPPDRSRAACPWLMRRTCELRAAIVPRLCRETMKGRAQTEDRVRLPLGIFLQVALNALPGWLHSAMSVPGWGAVPACACLPPATCLLKRHISPSAHASVACPATNHCRRATAACTTRLSSSRAAPRAMPRSLPIARVARPSLLGAGGWVGAQFHGEIGRRTAIVCCALSCLAGEWMSSKLMPA